MITLVPETVYVLISGIVLGAMIINRLRL